MRLILLLAVGAVLACDEPDERRVDAEELIPRGRARVDLSSRPEVVGPMWLCLQPRNGRVRVEGVLRREFRYPLATGGEAPRREIPDTIIELETPIPVRDCSDSRIVGGVPGLRLEYRLELVGTPREASARIGDTVRVYGSPEPAAARRPNAPLAIRVDSIRSP